MQSSSHHRPCRADARGSGTRQRTPKVAPPVLPPLRARYAPPAQSASRSTPTAMSARRFLTTVSVWSVICIILPCNHEYTLCGRATGTLKPHDPPSSYERIRAPPRISFPSPLVSFRGVSISLLFNSLSIRSARIDAVLFLSISPPSSHIPARPFHLIAHRNFSIPQLRRSYPRCRICVCGPCG